MSNRLRTLGGLSLESNGTVTPGRSTQRKRLALLALLAASRSGGVSRDKIIAYLWPERGEEQSRHALSQALYALRRALGEDSIVSGIDELRLDHTAVTSDVAQLNAAIAQRDLEAIVDVYAGAFLDGFFLPDAPAFEDWVATRRGEYERAFTDALDALAARALTAGDPQRAARLLQKHAGVDPLNSQVALRLMEALSASGDRAGALRHFRTHQLLLREEMQMTAPAELAAFAAECARASSGSEAPPQAVRNDPAIEEFAAAPVTRRTANRRRPIALAGFGLVLIAAIVIAYRSSSTTHTSHVLLAAVSGPDTSLALAVREALRAELEQSNSVRVLGDVVTARTLELMRLPPSTPLDEARALEVAQRRGIPFVVSASVHPVGDGTQIVARILDVAHERVLATITKRPARDGEVLSAVDAIAEQMRERVTDAEPRAASPLPAVTTASLPALRNYALARNALASWDRRRALDLVEAALVHDSSFAIAHYLAADLLWYIDKQRHSDEHMQRALALADRLPPREQLIVRARYFQLMRDEPDSALVYWKLLADSYPEEPLAYEGMRWVYRALGQTRAMANASELGSQYDGAQRLNANYDRMTERLEARDSVGFMDAALANGSSVEYGRFQWSLARGRALPPAEVATLSDYDRHMNELMLHRFDSASAALGSLRKSPLQYYPRALLAQSRMEAEFGSREAARARLHEAVAWIEASDLSPPAYARLAERAAEAAVQVGDRQVLQRLAALIERHDRGRSLRSYRFARRSIAAADAMLRGDVDVALRESGRSPTAMFYARSVATVMMLRAEALEADQKPHQARRIYQQLAGQQVHDGDFETRVMVAHIASHRLERLGQK